MAVRLDLGYYVNMFEVIVPEQEIEIMICERSKYPSLKELRNQIKENRKEAFVYVPQRSDKIYGYGPEMSWLSNKGFSSYRINLYEIPGLTGRMILEGVINKTMQMGFVFLKFNQNADIYQILDKTKGRLKIFKRKPEVTSDGKVRVFIGYDLRVIFLRDPMENRLNFGLVVDITYSLRDEKDRPLNYRAIVLEFGPHTLREVRQIQRDLIPTGINREVSRQRLDEDIIPFVEELSEIELPCGLEAKITSEPCRIILGDKNEVIW